MGADWERLAVAYAATRTFRERVLGETSGEGTTGLDGAYAAAYFEGVGAEIMVAGMFGLHAFPDEPSWTGWWGDEPPFRVPVFVLTHATRPAVTMANGTSFEFLSVAAGGHDVRIGGGTGIVRDFLRAGLVDHLHVGITPIVLGQGAALGRPEGARGRLRRHQRDGRGRHHPRDLPALTPDHGPWTRLVCLIPLLLDTRPVLRPNVAPLGPC
jgi:hypothetical protein